MLYIRYGGTTYLLATQVPIFKQRRLTEVMKKAGAQTPAAVVEAAVAHAMHSTRGERELFEMIDVDSQVPLGPPISTHCTCLLC